MWAFQNELGQPGVTICSVEQTDADTLTVVKRHDVAPGFFFRIFGSDQLNVYERVIINRKEQTTAIDRIDVNFWHKEPFLGRRDFFFNE